MIRWNKMEQVFWLKLIFSPRLFRFCKFCNWRDETGENPDNYNFEIENFAKLKNIANIENFAHFNPISYGL